MLTKTFSIDLPDTVDGEIDALYVKESVSVTLYHAGKISEKQACLILGKTRQEFEDLLAKFGYSVLPDTGEGMAVESKETEKVKSTLSKWARLAQDIEENSPIEGMGEELLASIKEFREDFAFNHDE